MKAPCIAIPVLLVTAAALAQSGPPAGDFPSQLCERALRVGGPLESYLEGLGLTEASEIERARALLATLREERPELPESYLKLAVLMAAESEAGVTMEAAGATLRLLEACGEDAPPEPPPPPSPGAEPAPPAAGPGAPETVAAGEAVAPVAAPDPPRVSPPPPSPSPPAPPAAPQGTARELFFQGVSLAEQGDFEAAKEIFRALTRTYPQLPEPYVNLGVLLAAEGDVEEAGRMAEGALFAHPVCRAAFELTLMPALSAHSYAVLADLGREGSERVVRPLPQTPADVRAAAETVAAWSRAWAERRFDDYLEFYGPAFEPAGGDRERWRAALRARREEVESVKLENLSVDLTGPGRATAWFTHHFRTASGAGEVVEKALDLEKVEGSWKIVAERTGG